MIDTRNPESPSRCRGHLRKCGLASGGSANRAEPARGPERGGFGRWILDALVVGFAHGGCLHHTHPTYIDALRDLSRTQRR